MMQAHLRRAAVFALVLVCAGCQTYNVRTDWDPGVGFDELARFYWVEPPEQEGADPFADNTLLRKRVRFAVESVLSERGYRSVDSADEADFLVTYSVDLDERLRVDGVSSGIGSGYRRRGIGFGTGYSTTRVKAYQESTLILDFLSPADESWLWRGWATGLLGTRDRQRGVEQAEAGLRAILAEFPPQGPET